MNVLYSCILQRWQFFKWWRQMLCSHGKLLDHKRKGCTIFLCSYNTIFLTYQVMEIQPKKIISGTLNESQNPDSVGGGCNLNFSSGWHRVFRDNEAEIARRWCGQFNTAWRKILPGSLSWLRSGWWISLMWAIQCWVLLCVWNIVRFPELTWVGLMNLTEVKYNTDSATMPRKGEKLVALHCTCNVDN